ncbi:MAG: alpha/beta hydrolase [Gemmatimonadota bacterium]|nr:alpha/beta hydrolase [Gemmatimonadota bacterium]
MIRKQRAEPEERSRREPEDAESVGRFGTAGKAAVGLAAAAAAAYGVYLLGASRTRRRPVTELPNALGLRLEYVPWRGVHYAFYSRRGTGRPVVILHSINTVASAQEMRPVVQHFVRRTERSVFAPEWLGFGHSDRPEIAYTPELLEDQLEHFLEKVVGAAGGVDLVGLSLGATYAAEVARRRPDLVHSLAAIEPAGLGEEPAEIPRAWSRLLFTLPGVQRAFYDRLTTREALHDFARKNLFSAEFGVPDEYVSYGAETARMEGAARPLDDFLSGRLFPAHGGESFRRLRQPLLVIHGTVMERRMESFTTLPGMEARENVTLLPLPTGALPHWERPAEVWGAISDFQNRPAREPATSSG